MLTIGTLGRRTGTRIQTIRYCEQIGLTPEPERTGGGLRRRGAAALDRLSFIRHARQPDLSPGAIGELMELRDHPNRPCAEADASARRQLRRVERRITPIEALPTGPAWMVRECRGGRTADCRVPEVPRDHSECPTDHEAIGG